MYKTLLFVILLVCIFSNAKSNTYQEIDVVANSLPSNYHNAKELANDIDIDSLSSEEKLRLLYVWLSNNITYDVTYLETGIGISKWPSDVLKNKIAVCAGYAEVFDSVCNYLDIESYKVVGYSKSNFNPRSGDHVWNVVKINDKWQVIDCTWGAGEVIQERKKNIIDILFRRSKLKNKYRYTPKINERFFLTTEESLKEYHLPIDPMWQLSDSIISFESFEKGTFSYPKKYFNYTDTIHKFQNLPTYEQAINSAQRANNYNHLNYLDLALAYIDEGNKHYAISKTIVRESVKYLKEELESTVFYYEKGDSCLSIAQHINDSIYKSNVANYKANYKQQAKQLKNFKKQIKKSEDTNRKMLDKRKSEGAKVKDKKEKLKETEGKTYKDYKIYSIKRPNIIPGYYDSLIFTSILFKADSVNNLFKLEKDTLIKEFKYGFNQLYDSVLQIRNISPNYIEACNKANVLLKDMLSNNQPNTLIYTDSIITIASNYYTQLQLNQNIAINLLKVDLKEKHNQIKNKLKTAENQAKELKKHLIDCKKASFMDQDEEERYEDINKELQVLYQTYLIILNNESLFYTDNQKVTKKEIKQLKKHQKEISETEKLLNNYYRYNLAKKKTIYTNEKNMLKSESKTTRKSIGSCKKILGE